MSTFTSTTAGWKCQDCGYTFFGHLPPDHHTCPAAKDVGWGGFSTKQDSEHAYCLQLEGLLAVRTAERDVARSLADLKGRQVDAFSALSKQLKQCLTKTEAERDEARAIARRLKVENAQLVEKLEELKKESARLLSLITRLNASINMRNTMDIFLSK